MVLYPATSSFPGPLDLELLYELAGGNKDFVQEFLTLLLENTHICLLILEHQCDKNAHEKWDETLEELKNVADSFGARAVANLCQSAMEHKCRTHDSKVAFTGQLKEELHHIKIFLEQKAFH